MAIEGVTWSNWNALSPPTSNVLYRKTVTTNTQNTTVKITKPIHPGVLEGSKKWEGKLHRKKKKCSQSVQAQELANARNGWKLWPFQT